MGFPRMMWNKIYVNFLPPSPKGELFSESNIIHHFNY